MDPAPIYIPLPTPCYLESALHAISYPLSILLENLWKGQSRDSTGVLEATVRIAGGRASSQEVRDYVKLLKATPEFEERDFNGMDDSLGFLVNLMDAISTSSTFTMNRHFLLQYVRPKCQHCESSLISPKNPLILIDPKKSESLATQFKTMHRKLSDCRNCHVSVGLQPSHGLVFRIEKATPAYSFRVEDSFQIESNGETKEYRLASLIMSTGGHAVCYRTNGSNWFRCDGTRFSQCRSPSSAYGLERYYLGAIYISSVLMEDTMDTAPSHDVHAKTANSASHYSSNKKSERYPKDVGSHSRHTKNSRYDSETASRGSDHPYTSPTASRQLVSTKPPEPRMQEPALSYSEALSNGPSSSSGCGMSGQSRPLDEVSRNQIPERKFEWISQLDREVYDQFDIMSRLVPPSPDCAAVQLLRMTGLPSKYPTLKSRMNISLANYEGNIGLSFPMEDSSKDYVESYFTCCGQYSTLLNKELICCCHQVNSSSPVVLVEPHRLSPSQKRYIKDHRPMLRCLWGKKNEIGHCVIPLSDSFCIVSTSEGHNVQKTNWRKWLEELSHLWVAISLSKSTQ